MYVGLYVVSVLAWLYLAAGAGKTVKPVIEQSQNMTDVEALSYFRICHKSDPNIAECIKKSITEALPKLIKGIPELDLAPLDPLFLPKLEMKDGSGSFQFKQILTDVNIYGLSKFKFENSKVDLAKNYMELTTLTPSTNFVGNYDMEGKLLNLQIKGNGKCSLNFTNVRTTAFIQNEIYKNKGKDYVRVKDLKWSIDPENAKFYFSNLFNGDKTLGDATNKFINENWREAFKIYKNLPEEAFAKLIKDISNRVYSHFPAEELYPD